MKRFLVTFLSVILTFAVSAAGFLLPQLLNEYQDERIFSTIEHSSIEPMEFTYSSSLLDTLRLISSGYFLVEYPATASRHSDDDIYQTSLHLVKTLKQYGIEIFDEDDAIINHETYLHLAIASNNTKTQTEASATDNGDEKQAAQTGSMPQSNSNSQEITTAVIWRCILYSANGYWVSFKIDDKSGEMIDFSIFSEQTIASAYSKTEIEKLVNSVCAFLENHYKLPADPILQKMEPASTGFFEKQPFISETHYIIQFKETSGNLIQIPLRIHTNYLVMNNLYE